MRNRIALAAIAAINAVATSPPTVARKGQAIGHTGISARATGCTDFKITDAQGSGYSDAGGDNGGYEGTPALA